MNDIDTAVIWRLLQDSRRYLGLGDHSRLREVRGRRDARWRTMRRSRRDYPEDPEPASSAWDRRRRPIATDTQQRIGEW
jgi:hypothetical protein